MTCPLQDQTAQWLLGELLDDEAALHVATCPACTALADAYVAVLSVASPACAEEGRTLAWLYGADDEAVAHHAASCPACARSVREHSDLLVAVAPVVPALRAPTRRSEGSSPVPRGESLSAGAASASGRRWRGWIALAAAAALMVALAPTAFAPSAELSGAPGPTSGALASSAASALAAPAAAAPTEAKQPSPAASSAAPPAASAAPSAGSRVSRAAVSTPRQARRAPRLASSPLAPPAARPAGPLPVALAADVDLDHRLDALSAELAAFASDPSLL